MSPDSDYALFGLQPGTSPEELKTAYRDLVKVWHPDRLGSNPRLQRKAQEKLKEINLVYERLQSRLISSASASTVPRGETKTADAGEAGRGASPPPPQQPQTGPESVGTPVRVVWVALASLLAMLAVVVFSLMVERVKGPRAPESVPYYVGKPEESRSNQSTPALPFGGVEEISRPGSRSLIIQSGQPDCPRVWRIATEDGQVHYTNVPPKEMAIIERPDCIRVWRVVTEDGQVIYTNVPPSPLR